MAEAFVFNVDALVTKDYLKDYLDARFAEHEARMDARMDTRFTAVNTRFATLETRMDLRFTEMDGKFRLHTWMLAVVIASTVIPAVHKLLA